MAPRRAVKLCPMPSPDAELGINGEGFLKELRGCGEVTKWKFEYTPHDIKYQWYAHGYLPIGSKGCVGNAVISAGGASKGICHEGWI